MKLETVVVYAKLVCIFGGTSLLTLQTGLSQWSNEPTNPSIVQWILILSGSFGAGLTATAAFLSDAFGNYLKFRSSNGNGNGNRNEQPPVFTTPPLLTTPPVSGSIKP